MKNSKKILQWATIAALAFSIPLNGCEKVEMDNVDVQSGIEEQTMIQQDLLKQLEGISPEPLSEAERAGLLFLREEEKLARDVYLFLAERFPLRPLQNIPKSEQQHINAVKFLLERYDIEDPVAEDVKGVFQNADLQDLYNSLIVEGSKGEVEALKVGALIEEKDIQDLQQEIDHAIDNKDILYVYENLKKGSENHLRAFTRLLSKYGVDYSPQILEETDYRSIITK